jgi:redox-sensitive bicupin YhaK (pirin superfamily)
MTRLDAPAGGPPETETPVAAPPLSQHPGPRALLLEAREVPLGGVRGMSVHRSLPQRELPMVGAWCFLDRFGPQTTRMRVEPHPHIGLQTVTWPFVGEVRHRDAIGSDVVVRRGALNIMTSGAGISHSEYSVGEDAVPLDALQLWVALPESRRHGDRDFERIEDLPRVDLGDGAGATVVVGEFGGAVSPARMYTPIVGAEVFLPAGSHTTLPLEAHWEYAIVGISGDPSVEAEGAGTGDGMVTLPDLGLLYLGTGRTGIRVHAPQDATVFVLGGEPFDDEIVMWWNFVGRSHEEIVDARDAWEAGTDRFGHVTGHGDERIPAPPLPGVRLTRRRRRI